MFESGLWQRRAHHKGRDIMPNGTGTTPEKGKPADRPTIGVALGGGAARGWAHIGVLRVLEQAGFKPDIVAGTSIGAVVGGAYAANGLDRIEDFALHLNKRRMFSLMDFNLGGSGLINGNRLGRLLTDGLRDIQVEDLPVRFVAIATELGTGHEIWLSKGNAVEALRASYAMPGIFKPVRVHGRWLIDGALVNPIPVSVCRAFGARLVIAVNLNADVFGHGTTVRAHDPVQISAGSALDSSEDGEPDSDDTGRKGTGDAARRLLRRQLVGGPDGPPGISSVMIDAFTIVQDRIARSRLAGDPPDIMIGPYLSQIGLFDFHKAREAIAAGEQAASRSLADIESAVLALGA